MDAPLNIAFLAAEALPYAKAGGLGDVAGALPRALAARGHAVTLVLPLHAMVDRGGLGLEPCGHGRLPWPDAERPLDYSLWRHEASAGLRAVFVDVPRYFQRPGLYTDPVTGQGYPDDGERFLAFSMAALEFLAQGEEAFDLIHCNDYHCGPVPPLLERAGWRRGALANSATVFSIHNLAYQGVFPLTLLDRAGLDDSEARFGSPFEFWGQLNFMKAGILAADLVSTVSPRYAQEIVSGADYGHGLEGVLADRGDDLVGILNGIDPEEWSPQSDPRLAQCYTAETVDAGKAANKAALQAELGLPVLAEPALLGIVSRLVRQKGFDLFAPVIEGLMALPLQLAILGSGEVAIEDAFKSYARRYPDKLSLSVRYDDRLAHRIEAGADFFLMPSRYEPCGLNQLYSLRYGTLPIVRETGGLADTVRDLDAHPEDGNGFVFPDPEPALLLQAVRRALRLKADAPRLGSLRRRVMGLDFSWNRSADDYLRLYGAAQALRRGEAPRARALIAEIREAQRMISRPSTGQGP